MATLFCKQAWPWVCFHHVLSHCNQLSSELIQSFDESSRPLIKHTSLSSHMHVSCVRWLYFYSWFPGIDLNLILKIRLPFVCSHHHSTQPGWGREGNSWWSQPFKLSYVHGHYCVNQQLHSQKEWNRISLFAWLWVCFPGCSRHRESLILNLSLKILATSPLSLVSVLSAWVWLKQLDGSR